MHTYFKPVLSAIALCLATMSLATPAMAVKWKSKVDPLYVYEDGIAQGRAFGKFFNDEQVLARSTTWQSDLKPGGNAVRIETDFMFYAPRTTCGGQACWYTSTSKQTEETRTLKWVRDSRARKLAPDGDKARGHIDICEIQSWHNDPCSAKALPTFGY